MNAFQVVFLVLPGGIGGKEDFVRAMLPGDAEKLLGIQVLTAKWGMSGSRIRGNGAYGKGSVKVYIRTGQVPFHVIPAGPVAVMGQNQLFGSYFLKNP